MRLSSVRVLLTEGEFSSLFQRGTRANPPKRGETEDLGRFNIEFNFPSPRAPSPVENPMEEEPTQEVFELPTGNVDVQQDLDFGGGDAMPSDDDDDDNADETGGLGLEVNITPERPEAILHEEVDIGSEQPGAESPTIPGILGGGLREEDHPSEPGKKRQKLSRHGIPLPAIPSGVVRRVAGRFAKARAGSKTRINKPALNAFEQATSWFFEQMSEDLEAYSKHAGRKTIDESDVVTLMKRCVCSFKRLRVKD